eukprot:2848547-Pyramimonas_sp.AAC.1
MKTARGDACEHRHSGLWWTSMWGHETLHWVGETHANTATGAFSGAPSGATIRCTGLGKHCLLYTSDAADDTPCVDL